MIGLDTGFFFRVFEGNKFARAVWTEILDGREIGAVCTLTLFELVRSGHRGKLPRDHVRAFARRLPELCHEAGIAGIELAERAAGISHGTGIPAVDALIITALADAGVQTVYTTDADLKKWKSGPRVVVI